MQSPRFFVLYVSQLQASSAFYAALLGHEPLRASPAFVEFALDNGLRLGLFLSHTAAAGAGSVEIVFEVDTPQAVDAAHADWAGRGIAIKQAPATEPFGHTFVALDPDGHKLRVLCEKA